MKAVKLSLAAALVATSAMALEVKDVKVDAEAKVWYQTKSNSADKQSFFGKNGATGQATANVGISGSLAEKVGFGVRGVVLDTLGLESNTVSGVAAGAYTNGKFLKSDASPDALKNQSWISEAFMTYKTSNTTAKIGRQTLDTPLAYSEDWNVVANTFEALALINTDLPDTTLVAAHVARGNGTLSSYANALLTTSAPETLENSLSALAGQTVANNGEFSTYATNGARAIGAINKSIEGVTAQAWYYDLMQFAKAYWLQADAKLPMNMTAGVQYASVDVDKKGTNLDATTAYAVKVGTNLSGVDVYAAYSSVNDSNGLPVANTATGFKKTKLYTASILSDGTVAAQQGTTAYKVGASTKVGDFNVAASYGSYEMEKNAFRTAAVDPKEIDLSVSTKIADVKVAAYYINQADFDAAGHDQQAVRVIASLGF